MKNDNKSQPQFFWETFFALSFQEVFLNLFKIKYIYGKKKLAVPEILHQSRQIGKHQEPGRQGIKETWL